MLTYTNDNNKLLQGADVYIYIYIYIYIYRWVFINIILFT